MMHCSCIIVVSIIIHIASNTIIYNYNSGHAQQLNDMAHAVYWMLISNHNIIHDTE